MAMLEKSVQSYPLATANPTTLLAASSTVTRWIRGITIVNNGSAGTWNFGATTTATLTAANAIWFGISIAAGATFVHFFPGRGLRLGGTDIIAGFASATNMSLSVHYTEQDLT
jgi:hypothetical protein